MRIEIQDFLAQRSNRKTPKLGRQVASSDIHLPSGKGSPWKHTRTGVREDLNLLMRSGWEANLARVLKAYGVAFEFEPMLFTYPVRRGTRGYTPDFFLKKTKEWVEVKGYFDSRSRIKIKRFKKYYPEEFDRLTMVIGNSQASIKICDDLGVPYVLYPEVAKLFKDRLRNWE